MMRGESKVAFNDRVSHGSVFRKKRGEQQREENQALNGPTVLIPALQDISLQLIIQRCCLLSSHSFFLFLFWPPSSSPSVPFILFSRLFFSSSLSSLTHSLSLSCRDCLRWDSNWQPSDHCPALSVKISTLSCRTGSFLFCFLIRHNLADHVLSLSLLPSLDLFKIPNRSRKIYKTGNFSAFAFSFLGTGAKNNWYLSLWTDDLVGCFDLWHIDLWVVEDKVQRRGADIVSLGLVCREVQALGLFSQKLEHFMYRKPKFSHFYMFSLSVPPPFSTPPPFHLPSSFFMPSSLKLFCVWMSDTRSQNQSNWF